MSLVRFKAQNHRQQVNRRGPNPKVDDRATDPAEFARFHRRFQFTVDVAAQPHNAKCVRYFTPEQDGLAQSWAGERVWCNPPYSDIEPWVIKAWRERSELVVMLVPANRTEQKWWQQWVEPYRDRGLELRVEFLPGRMRFIAHDAERVGMNERPPFGCCLLVWTPERRSLSEHPGDSQQATTSARAEQENTRLREGEAA